LEEVEAAVEEEIAVLKTELASPREMLKVRNQTEVETVEHLASNAGLASRLGSAWALTGNWRSLFSDQEKLTAARPRKSGRRPSVISLQRTVASLVWEAARCAWRGAGRPRRTSRGLQLTRPVAEFVGDDSRPCRPAGIAVEKARSCSRNEGRTIWISWLVLAILRAGGRRRSVLRGARQLDPRVQRESSPLDAIRVGREAIGVRQTACHLATDRPLCSRSTAFPCRQFTRSRPAGARASCRSARGNDVVSFGPRMRNGGPRISIEASVSRETIFVSMSAWRRCRPSRFLRRSASAGLRRHPLETYRVCKMEDRRGREPSCLMMQEFSRAGHRAHPSGRLTSAQPGLSAEDLLAHLALPAPDNTFLAAVGDFSVDGGRQSPVGWATVKPRPLTLPRPPSLRVERGVTLPRDLTQSNIVLGHWASAGPPDRTPFRSWTVLGARSSSRIMSGVTEEGLATRPLVPDDHAGYRPSGHGADQERESEAAHHPD
jgi:hypothetical protein